jgi:hypothetical protein
MASSAPTICCPGLPNSRKNSKLFLGIPLLKPKKTFTFSQHNFPDAWVKHESLKLIGILARSLTTCAVPSFRKAPSKLRDYGDKRNAPDASASGGVRPLRLTNIKTFSHAEKFQKDYFRRVVA